MPHEVIVIRPNPNGGNGLSEGVAEAIAQTYDRVAAVGGEIIASHTIRIAQYPQGADELFIVARMPEDTVRQTVTTISVDPNSR